MLGWLLVFLLLPGLAEAACTVTTANTTQAVVQAAVTAAAVGATVCVPSGSSTWNSPVSVTKGITLQGAGIGQTVITAITGASAPVEYQPSNPALNAAFRLTGFEFDLQLTSAGLHMTNDNTLNVQTNIRIDHNRWRNGISGRQWHFSGGIYGVFDNNILDGDQIITPYGNNEYSWTNFSCQFGTSQVMVFEANTFNRINTDWYIIEGGLGGRYVTRFNTVNLVRSAQPLWDAHGNQGAGNNTANMCLENYRNTIIGFSGSSFYQSHRGGKAAVWGNTATTTTNDVKIREEFADASNPPAFGPTGQPQHVSDSYYWDNAGGDGAFSIYELDDCCGAITANVDYWLYQSSFNGTVGTGSGTLAARPATCTTGVGYWANNQGSWNTSGSGGQGLLYKCTSTNTWTLYYTPLAYPHPLRGSTPDITPPAAPTGVTVSQLGERP